MGAVVLNQNNVLLVKHHRSKAGFWANQWICPGGRLEVGETLEEAARREVFEETGGEITISGKPIAFERILKDPSGRTVLHVVYIDFLATLKGDSTLQPGSDVGEARWFPFDDIPWQELHEDTATLLEKTLGLRAHNEQQI